LSLSGEHGILATDNNVTKEIYDSMNLQCYMSQKAIMVIESNGTSPTVFYNIIEPGKKLKFQTPITLTTSTNS